MWSPCLESHVKHIFRRRGGDENLARNHIKTGWYQSEVFSKTLSTWSEVWFLSLIFVCFFTLIICTYNIYEIRFWIRKVISIDWNIQPRASLPSLVAGFAWIVQATIKMAPINQRKPLIFKNFFLEFLFNDFLRISPTSANKHF